MTGHREYLEVLKRLSRARRHGMKLSLSRVQRVRERLGHPDVKIPFLVQVGGTNGKGSTAAFIASILEAAGIRAGLFTSPHLLEFRERFAVGGQPLSESAIARAARQVFSSDPEEELTFFEAATLIAAVAFGDAGVGAAVFEVGMGGRFDATTALCADVAVVTGVSLDHEEYLGATLDRIAREKAGIFRVQRPAVIGCSGEEEAVALLVDGAHRARAHPISVVSELADLPGPLGLAGAHQRRNAAAALQAIDELCTARDLRVTPEARKRGLATARFPGRLERFGNVLLDGAHNPQGAQALARALGELAVERPRHLILGASQGKDVAGMCRALLPAVDRVFATQATSERALAASAIAEAATGACPDKPVHAVPNLDHALSAARAAEAGTVIVAGSLFLVGEARALLTGSALESIDMQDPVGDPRGCHESGPGVRSSP